MERPDLHYFISDLGNYYIPWHMWQMQEQYFLSKIELLEERVKYLQQNENPR